MRSTRLPRPGASWHLSPARQAGTEWFSHLFGCPMEMGEGDLLMMSAMFFDRDGAGVMDLNVPREEALSTVFMRLDISREVAKQLVRQFEDQVEAWFASVAAMAGR